MLVDPNFSPEPGQARVTPSKSLTIPRGKLNALTLLSRLMLILQMMTNLPTSSDMSTRATAKIAELGPNRVHQSGPEFLCLPRSEWPVARDFCTVELPPSEVRARGGIVFAAALRTNFCNAATAVDHQKNTWAVIEELLHYTNDVKKLLRIIARYLRGLEAGFGHSQVMTMENAVAYNLIAPAPKKVELERAERLLLLHGMDEKLIVTRGRLGEKSLERSLICTLARSRKKVVNSCPRWDLDGKSTLLQQMADIMEEQVVAVQRPAVLQAAGEKPPS